MERAPKSDDKMDPGFQNRCQTGSRVLAANGLVLVGPGFVGVSTTQNLARVPWATFGPLFVLFVPSSWRNCLGGVTCWVYWGAQGPVFTVIYDGFVNVGFHYLVRPVGHGFHPKESNAVLLLAG